jgi:hypothetical protein
MKTSGMIAAIIAILLLWASPSAFAQKIDSLRCEGGVVTTGASRPATVEKCGMPGDGRMHQEIRQGGVVMVEQWAYDYRPEDYLYILSFEGLTLKRIERR